MWPSSIAVDQDENLYISDEALQRITILDKRGQFLAKWGTKGKDKASLTAPPAQSLIALGISCLWDTP